MRKELDNEKQTGVILRGIVDDITKEYKNIYKKLYSDIETGEMTDVGEICCWWHLRIINHFGSMENTKPYIAMIQLAFKKNINLDKMESWRTIMRLKFGAEYIQMFDKFTQVPQIAARDLSERKTEFEVNPWG